MTHLQLRFLQISLLSSQRVIWSTFEDVLVHEGLSGGSVERRITELTKKVERGWEEREEEGEAEGVEEDVIRKGEVDEYRLLTIGTDDPECPARKRLKIPTDQPRIHPTSSLPPLPVQDHDSYPLPSLHHSTHSSTTFHHFPQEESLQANKHSPLSELE